MPAPSARLRWGLGAWPRRLRSRLCRLTARRRRVQSRSLSRAPGRPGACASCRVAPQQRGDRSEERVDLVRAFSEDVGFATRRILDVLPRLELDVGEAERGHARLERTRLLRKITRES